jgi:hypothetical protein
VRFNDAVALSGPDRTSGSSHEDEIAQSEALTVSGVSLGSTSTTTARYGIVANATYTVYMDDLGYSPTAALGPAGAGGNNFTQTPTDDRGLTDAAVLASDKGVPATDDRGLSDALGTVQLFSSPITDDRQLSDVMSADSVYPRAVTDERGLTDSAIAALQQAGIVTTTDNRGVTDSYSLAVGSNLTDTMGLTDSITVTCDHPVNPTDTRGLTDTRIQSQGMTLADERWLTDSLGLQGPPIVYPIPVFDDRALFDELVLDHYVAPSEVLYFTTPTWRNHSRYGNGLQRRLYIDTGHSILRFGTSYQQIDNPSTVQVETADAAFIGGRTYAIDGVEADALRQAGYSHWITDNLGDHLPEIDYTQYGTGLYGTGPYGA